MKASVTLLWSVIILALFCLAYSCKSKSIFRSNQKSSLEAIMESDLSELKNVETTALDVSRRSDSTQHHYTVVIYPVDSFHFSPVDGFLGKALKVKIRGSTQQVGFASDSSTITQSQFNSTEAVVKSEYQYHDRQEISLKEKQSRLVLPVLFWTLLGTVVGIVLYYNYVRYRGY